MSIGIRGGVATKPHTKYESFRVHSSKYLCYQGPFLVFIKEWQIFHEKPFFASFIIESIESNLTLTMTFMNTKSDFAPKSLRCKYHLLNIQKRKLTFICMPLFQKLTSHAGNGKILQIYEFISQFISQFIHFFSIFVKAKNATPMNHIFFIFQNPL